MSKSSKIPAVKGLERPAIIKTPQNYSENIGSATRTDFYSQDRSLIAISTSLLSKFNSLFSKNFSLLSDFEFPVNFEARITQTTRTLKTGVKLRFSAKPELLCCCRSLLQLQIVIGFMQIPRRDQPVYSCTELNTRKHVGSGDFKG